MHGVNICASVNTTSDPIAVSDTKRHITETGRTPQPAFDSRAGCFRADSVRTRTFLVPI